MNRIGAFGATVVFAVVAVCADAAQARILTAWDPQSLQSAMVAARSGDEIAIEPGCYGALAINPTFPVTPGVTFAGMPGEERPCFSSIRLNGVRDITFKNLNVEYGPTNSPASSYAVELYGVSGIIFEQTDISSASDGVAGNDSYGVFVRASSNVTLLRNAIHDVFRGVAVFDSDDVSIIENSITNAGSDGVVGRGLLRAKINLNYFSDFDVVNVNDPHPDAIQIWTRGAPRASSDIEIEGNIIRRGGGDPAQGILVGGDDYPTSNLLIADNVIEISMAQGILVSNVVASNIRDNTIIPFDFRSDAPGIDIRSDGIELSDNVAMSYRLPAGISGPNALGIGNIRADYYNPWINEFIGNLISNPANPSDPLDYAALTAAGAWTFVASSAWLGDPSIPDGSLTPPPVIADIDFANGPVDSASDPLQLAQGTDSGGGTYVYSNAAPKLTSALSLSIDARVRASSNSGYKYAAVVSNSYDLRVDQGRVMFSVWTAGGVTRLSATAPMFKDLSAHDLRASYDGVAGEMRISVDGVELARRAAPTGPVAYHPTYKLFAGGAPWGGSIGGGLERLRISR